MEIQKTTGIILSSRNSGESDKICNVLTKDYGKRTFIFKGIRKSKKRPPLAAEIGVASNLVYYYHSEKHIHVINECTIAKHHDSLNNDLRKIYHLYFILELVDKTSGFDDPIDTLFKMLLAGIEVLANSLHPDHFTVFFLIHLLRLHGILPSLDTCKSCGSHTFDSFYLDINDLHIVCNACQKHKHSFSRDIKLFLEESMRKKFQSIDLDRYDNESMKRLIYLMTIFYEHYFNIKINSSKFLQMN